MLSKLPPIKRNTATRSVAAKRIPSFGAPIALAASLFAVLAGLPAKADAKVAYAEPVPIEQPVAKAVVGAEDSVFDITSELGRRRTNYTFKVDGHDVTVEMDLPTGPFAYAVGVPVSVYAQSRTGTPSFPVKLCGDANCDVVLGELTVTAEKAHNLQGARDADHQTLMVYPNENHVHLHVPGHVQGSYPYRQIYVTRTSAEWVVAAEGPSMDVVSAGRIPDGNGGTHGFAGMRAVTFFNMFEKHPELVHGFHAIIFHPATTVSPALQAELVRFVQQGGVVIAGEQVIPAAVQASGKWGAIASPGQMRKYSSNVTISPPNLDAAAMIKDEDGVWIRHAYAGLNAEEATAALQSVRPEFALARTGTDPITGPPRLAATIAVHRFNSSAVAVTLGFLWIIAAFAALMSVRKRRWTTVLTTLGSMSLATTAIAFLGASAWRTSSESVTVTVQERFLGQSTSLVSGVSAQRTGMWGRKAVLATPPAAHVAVSHDAKHGKLTASRDSNGKTVVRAENADIVFASWQTKVAHPAVLQVVGRERDRDDGSRHVPVVKNTSTAPLSFVGISGPSGTRWLRTLKAGETVSYNALHNNARGSYALDDLRDDSDRSTLPARRLAREMSRHCDNSRGQSFNDFSCVVGVGLEGQALNGHIVYGFGVEGGAQ